MRSVSVICAAMLGLVLVPAGVEGDVLASIERSGWSAAMGSAPTSCEYTIDDGHYEYTGNFAVWVTSFKLGSGVLFDVAGAPHSHTFEVATDTNAATLAGLLGNVNDEEMSLRYAPDGAGATGQEQLESEWFSADEMLMLRYGEITGFRLTVHSMEVTAPYGSMDWKYDTSYTWEVLGVAPEPASMSLLAMGGLAVAIRRRR
ncbi:MAG: PEP-CTERM sorting domain-containing protein [Phycisphaerae bacterium]